MKGLGVSIALGMMVVFGLLIGYWRHTPYAISAPWDDPVDCELISEDPMRNPSLMRRLSQHGQTHQNASSRARAYVPGHRTPAGGLAEDV
ncbi:MAG: hypothetical protein K0S45_4424 [Nitrospira sp.]|nr:hypothetical protein [Nitrospira sp.]